MITQTITKSTSPLAERIAAQNEIIFKLKQQIEEQREKKRQLERKQRQIDKLVKAAATLELAEDEETINYLWESLAAVLPLRSKSEVEEEVEITPNSTAEVESNPTSVSEVDEIEEEELIKNPLKKNTSNSFFAWQPTSNPARHLFQYHNWKNPSSIFCGK